MTNTPWNTRYALRGMHKGQQVVLLQIAGDGRIRVRGAKGEWWTRPPLDSVEVFEVGFHEAAGDTFQTVEEATDVGDRLTRE